MYVCITFSIFSFYTNFALQVKNILLTSSGWAHDSTSPFICSSRFSLNTWSLWAVSILGFRALVNLLLLPFRSVRKRSHKCSYLPLGSHWHKICHSCCMLLPHIDQCWFQNFKFIHTVIDHKVYLMCSVESTLSVLPFLTPTILCWFSSLVCKTKFLLLLGTRFSSLPDLP